MGREDDQTQGDQAVNDEVLEIVPPGDEELLCVGVWEGADESGANSRHDDWWGQNEHTLHSTDQVSAEDQGNTLVTPDTSEALGALRPPVSQVERDEDMRVEA